MSKEQKFDNLLERLELNIINIINLNKDRLNNLKSSYILNNPELKNKKKKDQYNNLMDKLNVNIKANPNNSTNKYLLLINKLETLNPLSTIKRGYSIVRKDNKVISSVKNIKKDDLLELEVIDGTIKTKVI